jgi:hypothetical protein
MGDFVIRDIPDDLKQDIADLARQSGRSLSDEAKQLLQKGLVSRKGELPSDSYAEYRHEFADALLTDDEHTEMMSAIDAWKQESLPPKAEAAE